MKTIQVFASKLLPLRIAYAHCDIPCGIYDPHLAQVCAHTVIRMTQLLEELKKDRAGKLAEKEFVSAVSRYTHVKEEHAELVKREVRIIWGDYFKPEHLKEYPQLHALVFSIMKHASKARQEVNMEEAEELLALVQKFAEIFWKTKGIETVRMRAPYPSGGEIVVQKAK